MVGFENRAVVVAGAGGLGASCATAFAANGARVAVIDVDEAALSAVQRDARASGHDVELLVADLGTPAGCRDAVDRAVDRLGTVEAFVHAVGVNDRRAVLETPDEVWEQLLTLNLSSAFWCGRAVGDVMCRAGTGRIVYLSSVSGLLAHRHHAPYAASKGGMNQMMRVMAREWAASGVTVNAVAPGYTETDLTRDYLAKPGMREQMIEQVPAGRLGTADDVVGPVLFLASDLASFVTGHVLYVDGGRTLV